MKDRSDLSGMYPSVSGRTDNKSYRAPKVIRTVEYKLNFINVLVIATYFALPVAMAVILLNFYRDLQVDRSNVYYMLPVMILPFALWGALLILSFIKILHKLDDQDANKPLFLTFSVLCGLSITKLLYGGFGVFSNYLIGGAIFTIALLVAFSIFVFWILWLMGNQKMNEPRKLTFLVVTVLACLVSMLFYA